MNKKMKRPLCLALTVCLVLSLLAGSAYAVNRYFEDAKGHWAEEAIQILTEKGVISGYPDGLAHPDDIITRGEFAALVSRTMELPEPVGTELYRWASEAYREHPEQQELTFLSSKLSHRCTNDH